MVAGEAGRIGRGDVDRCAGMIDLAIWTGKEETLEEGG